MKERGVHNKAFFSLLLKKYKHLNIFYNII